MKIWDGVAETVALNMWREEEQKEVQKTEWSVNVETKCALSAEMNGTMESAKIRPMTKIIYNVQQNKAEHALTVQNAKQESKKYLVVVTISHAGKFSFNHLIVLI